MDNFLKDNPYSDFVLIYLIYVFMSVGYVLLYAKLLDAHLFNTKVRNDIHTENQKDTESDKSDQFDNDIEQIWMQRNASRGEGGWGWWR